MRFFWARFLNYPGCTIAAFGGGFAALMVILFVVDLRSRYHAAIELAKQSTSDYASVLSEHTARAFEAVDRSLREVALIRGNLAPRDDETPEEATERVNAANDALRHLQKTSPLLVSIAWTDAAGNMQASSTDVRKRRRNIAETTHFIAHRDVGGDELFIASPFRSTVTGRWLAVASRRLNNPDGSFAGVAGAVIDQSYFAGIYRSIRLGRNGAVSVFNRNGTVLVREPPVDDALTRSFAHSPLLTEHLGKSPAGSYESVSVVDKMPRIVSYQAVPGLPLVIAVSRDRSDVLLPWYRYLCAFGLLTTLVAAVIGFGTFRLIRQAHNLAKKSDLLGVTLDNMAHGLCVFDASQRLVLCNRRYVEMYGFTAEQTRLGTPVGDIIAAWASRDRTPEQTREFVDRRVERISCGEPFYSVNTLADGRSFGITNQPILGGGWVAIHQDITESRRDEEQVAFMARHDVLTGISNRTSFMERLELAIAELRERDAPFTVFMLDLDRFKSVNDSLGHPAGDTLLKEAARRLRDSLRENDHLARIGGDEFAILLTADANQSDAAKAVANRVIDLITEPYDINGHAVNIGVSIGIAQAPADGDDADALMKRADLALYRTKSEGRNGFCFFNKGMTAEAEERSRWERDLRAALDNDELEVHYQPIVRADTQGLFSVEALARWRHPTEGYVPPSRFIPLAEACGLIDRLGEKVLRRACADAVLWPPHIKVAVNLSAMQFRKRNLLDVILCVLIETGLPPERLELEITETTLLENETHHLTVMRQLKNLGVAITLDDFGTGYSSLSYLTTFPFDKIKIDRSFTQNLVQRPDCAAIVSSVMALAAGLDLSTVAEGVETEQQFDLLRSLGVQFAQGFLFGRPCPAAELRFENPLGREMLGNVA